nr:hypothetical protein [Tanacetum cinerariifolium]
MCGHRSICMCDIEISMETVCLRLQVWYVIGVSTLRALVHAGDKTSRDARSWYMIREDGGGTDGRAGRGGGRTKGRSGDQGGGRNDGPGDLVGDQGRGQGTGRNQNGDAINDHIQGDVGNATEGNDRKGCTYKEFLACNLKGYDGKGGVIVYTRWMEKIESVHDVSGCRDSQRVKYTADLFVGMTWEGFRTLTTKEFYPINEMQKLETELWNQAMVEAGHAAYMDRFHELARLVPYLVTPKGKRIERYLYGLALQIRGIVAATEPKTIQKAMQIAGTLTDEALRNGTIKKNPIKRGNKGEPSKDRNGKDDNKRTRTGNAFDMTANLVRGGYMGTTPKSTTCSYHHSPETPYHSCFNCNHLGHFASDYRVMPRNVNPINARNPVGRTCYECGSADHIKAACPRNQGNQARGKAFMLEAEEARQDPNIVTGTFTLNNHFATTLFDSSADYSFVSTTFIPLLGIEPSDLEIKGHVFDINSIPSRSGSFDVIIGIDWLSDHKARINYHEKVVRIPRLDGKVLRVLEEKLEDKVRQLISVRTKEQKQEEIVVVRDFLEWREVQFLGHVINGDGIHVDPSKIEAVKNWKAPRTLFEVHSFLGLARYYLRLIEDFSKIAKPLTILSQKTLPDGSEDFVMYCDASGLGLGCVLMQRGKVIAYASSQKELNMRQRRWIELFSDYDCEIRYHLGKANVVADALSRKERVKPKRVRAMNMTLQALYYLDRIWVPLKGDVRTLIIDEAYKSKYTIHQGADKMYYDLRDRYWWSGIKKDIAVYEGIAMDFITKLPRTSSRHDTTWVIVDRLTKSAHFLHMREDYKIDRLARLYLSEIVARLGVPISIIFDRDSQFTSRFWKSMQEALGTRLDMITTYHPRTDGQSKCTIQTLEHMLRAYAEVGESHLIGPELVQETIDKISQIKDRLKPARDHQKSYADKRRKPLEFSIGTVAYQLELPEELNGIHDTFYMSNLKKCLANPTLQVPLNEIRVDDKLKFMEEPMEIMEREFKKLKRSRIAIVK